MSVDGSFKQRLRLPEKPVCVTERPLLRYVREGNSRPRNFLLGNSARVDGARNRPLEMFPTPISDEDFERLPRNLRKVYSDFWEGTEKVSKGNSILRRHKNIYLSKKIEILCNSFVFKIYIYICTIYGVLRLT